jgi:hypothetical protein
MLRITVSVGMRYWKEILIGLVFVLGTFPLFFFGYKEESQPELGGPGGKAMVGPLVLQYQPLLEEYAKQFGVLDYVPLMMAQMQQESGGRGLDPMQASESGFNTRYCKRPGCITDPNYSIYAGVQEFKETITKAKGDIKLALQGYNFGPGFINFAFGNGGKYTKELAERFSALMAGKLGWSCSYWQQAPYCYGDINYVDHVLRYYVFNDETVPVAITANAYGFIYPLTVHTTTSSYGYRMDPFTGIPKLHKGVDFSCEEKPLPVSSVKSGTVTRAGWENPSNHKQGYGQRVYVDYGNAQVSVYGHLSEIDVKPGQSIQQGQIIGKCGSTGGSTGMHLHFELQLNGKAIDPLPYLQ